MKRCICYASLVIFASFSFSFFSHAQPSAKFLIKGKVTGFEDSTWFYLIGSGTGVVTDSGQVIKGAFSIRGVLPGSVNDLQVLMGTKNFSDLVYIWVGKGTTFFTAEKGKFNAAKITGSPAQAIYAEYRELVKPYRNRLDSNKKLYKSAAAADKDKFLALELEIEKEELATTAVFIKKYPGSVISANLLSLYRAKLGKKTTRELYTALTPTNRASSFGKNVKQFLDLNKELRVGDQFADIEQTDSSGNKMRLSDIKGKYVLLEFWSSYCGPCRKENPDLVKMYNALKAKGFEIFAVSLDVNRRMWTNAIAADGLNWINVSEVNGEDNTAALTYGVYEMPTNFLIDRQGKIVAKNLRGKDLEKELDRLLN